MIFRQYIDSETSTYSYLLGDREDREAIIIDPVIEMLEVYLEDLKELKLKLVYSLDTHLHADHISASGKLRELTGAKTARGRNWDMDCTDLVLSDQDSFLVGKIHLKVLETPGHTEGCMSFFFEDADERAVFTGDALLIRACGRTDFQGGSSEKLFKSITKSLYSLPDDTFVYPGHDYNGRCRSTIGEEKRFNKRISEGVSQRDFCEIMKQLKLPEPLKIKESLKANLSCGKTEKRVG